MENRLASFFKGEMVCCVRLNEYLKDLGTYTEQQKCTRIRSSIEDKSLSNLRRKPTTIVPRVNSAAKMTSESEILNISSVEQLKQKKVVIQLNDYDLTADESSDSDVQTNDKDEHKIA